MDISEAKIFDASEPLSKVLDEILGSGTAVFITKNKELFGLIDDRNMRLGIADATSTKCESASVRCPRISEGAGVEERIDAFLSGHFKSLPVVDPKGRIIGATARADLLREFAGLRIIPRAQVYQFMNRPAYTIDCNQAIADAKSLMKKTGAHRLVVTRSGNVAGTISTFDFAGFLTKPKERQSYQLISEVRSLDSKKINEVMRENFVSMEETATLEEASLKMAAENVSTLVIVMDKKAVGILSATDIFKLVKKFYEPERDVMVSGLDADTLVYYGKIKEEILAIVSKFDKSVKIENLAVRIKKGKSVYEADMHFDLDNRHKAFKCEAYNITETIAAISKELKTMLEKAKSEKMERKKPPAGEAS